MRPRSATALLSSLLLFLAGCREIPVPVEPLAIPPAAEIEHLSVDRWRPDGSRESHAKIWDRRQIEAILAELGRHNTGYLTAMEDRPPQEVSIALNGRDRMEATVWIGRGWLGGVDRRHEDPDGGLAGHFRKLDAEQHRQLLLLVGRPTDGSE